MLTCVLTFIERVDMCICPHPVALAPPVVRRTSAPRRTTLACPCRCGPGAAAVAWLWGSWCTVWPHGQSCPAPRPQHPPQSGLPRPRWARPPPHPSAAAAARTAPEPSSSAHTCISILHCCSSSSTACIRFPGIQGVCLEVNLDKVAVKCINVNTSDMSVVG